MSSPPMTYGKREADQATWRSCSGCATARGVQNTALIWLTMDVLVPMPIAMVRMAIAERPGLAIQIRMA